ncbi:phosphatidylserine decarboxylase family protein [Bernardetia sp. OM2101]|uniref:phosphatidylserine decarboxylase family protein n=1 Tax=Bernardetia sp. OM2101 TaxID=3344876 RepID=UPI0035CF7DB7
MKIHKEGYPSLLLVIIFASIVIGSGYYFSSSFSNPQLIESIAVVIGVAFFLIILQFFRSPVVVTERNEKHIIAPANGKVVVIEEVEETEYFKDKRRQISIFMSPIDVHVNRNPLSGIVSYFKYHPGKYLVAWHPKASTDNERTTIVVKQPNTNTEVLFRQIAGALARRICWYVKEGQPVMQGEEFGFIKFGSRVDIFVPLDTEINVNLDQKTKAGRTVIATLK